MRQKIVELAGLGPLPDQHQIEDEHLKCFEDLLLDVVQDAKRQPLTNEEAEALAGLFGPDDCYSLAWTLLHLIETAPGWPVESCLQDTGRNTGNEWTVRLKQRLENARRLGLMP